MEFKYFLMKNRSEIPKSGGGKKWQAKGNLDRDIRNLQVELFKRK